MFNSNFNANNTTTPDYPGLVRFLIEPFLESPDTIFFDCESIKTTKRIWIRLAFPEEDKGKIYGRGGRNIQAIRHLLQTTADMAGDTLYFEIYDEEKLSQSNSNRMSFPKPFKLKEGSQRDIAHSNPIHGRRVKTHPPLKPRLNN